MRKSAIFFLQTVIVLVGLGVLALILWEPHIEGRNVHATEFQIYFHDPFLAYAYTASIAFFMALYLAIKLLGYVRRDEIFSRPAVNALRAIKICALTLIVFVLGAEAHSFIFVRGTDDIAGGVAIGLGMLFISAVAATAAAVFERTLQRAVELKSEHDLTV